MRNWLTLCVLKSEENHAGIKSQPSKLKFLVGCHLATNSFGLGRLFYKSSRQLQNFRHHETNEDKCLSLLNPSTPIF